MPLALPLGRQCLAVPCVAVQYSLSRTQGVMEMKDTMPQRLPLTVSSALLSWQAAGWV